ncbi:PLP-dependent aminotransferase family protein [Salinisphaera hydrothermalis]|uniref:MocR-like pyridoxine biosynthesis transcription factor PdxR n=1 Tax=Salinisphaera hydrothermalis TaxID=563188 RepID=UPI003340C1EC
MPDSKEPVRRGASTDTWIVDGLRLALARREADTTLARCLYDALRGWIQSGELAAGRSLPSSRRLARELGIGRNTALAALDHLGAEGFVDTRPGAGLYVADIGFRRPTGAAADRTSRSVGLSRRGQTLLAYSRGGQGNRGAFVPGVPALDAFPWAAWQRVLRRHRTRQRGRWLDYGAEGGHPALKAAIADYVTIARNVRCRADQILITHGAQHAFDLIARMLSDPGDTAWVEEPGYAGARAAFTAAGLSLAPVTVDAHGLDPAAAKPESARPKLIHLTPSNQFPMGVTLTMSRRQALLDLARRHGAWIIEDDYDSEFRYSSAPLSSLQGLTDAGDGGAPVLYVGTFSKTLYPGLRLGYVVLPPSLVAPMRRANVRQFREGDYIVQAALAAFMHEGGYAKHVARMRRLYRQRQARLREALGPAAELMGGDAGLHVVLRLASQDAERRLIEAAATQGIALVPLSGYYAEAPAMAGLVLGYANADETEIDRAGCWLRRELMG